MPSLSVRVFKKNEEKSVRNDKKKLFVSRCNSCSVKALPIFAPLPIFKRHKHASSGQRSRRCVCRAAYRTFYRNHHARCPDFVAIKRCHHTVTTHRAAAQGADDGDRGGKAAPCIGHSKICSPVAQEADAANGNLYSVACCLLCVRALSALTAAIYAARAGASAESRQEAGRCAHCLRDAQNHRTLHAGAQHHHSSCFICIAINTSNTALHTDERGKQLAAQSDRRTIRIC